MSRSQQRRPSERGTSRRGAHIGAPGAIMVLPAVSPYEWQTLCEHAAAAARQHGSVRMRIDGVECVVRRSSLTAAHSCAGCGGPLMRVTFRLAWRDLCGECARQSLGADGARDATGRNATAGR